MEIQIYGNGVRAVLLQNRLLNIIFCLHLIY